jgi:hypothetical protein
MMPPKERLIKMTKAAYVVAAIVPFGLAFLACVGIAHVAMVGIRERRAKRAALQKASAAR